MRVRDAADGSETPPVTYLGSVCGPHLDGPVTDALETPSRLARTCSWSMVLALSGFAPPDRAIAWHTC